MLIEWFGLEFWKAPTYSSLPRTPVYGQGGSWRLPGGTQPSGLAKCPARVRTSALQDSRPDPECFFGLPALKHQANKTRRISELNHIHARDRQSAGCWSALAASDLLASVIVKTIRGYKLAIQMFDTRYDSFDRTGKLMNGPGHCQRASPHTSSIEKPQLECGWHTFSDNLAPKHLALLRFYPMLLNTQSTSQHQHGFATAA